MTDFSKIAQDYWNQKPHPQAPSISVGEYPQAVKLATAAKFGGHATPAEAEAFWGEFKQLQKLGISPTEFLDMLDKIAPLTSALHGRPPSMLELAKFREAKSTPSQIKDYYSQLPDPHYPTVPAGEMAKHLAAAEPHAQMAIGRKPVKKEAAYLYHSGQNPQQFFQMLAQQMAQMKGAQQAAPQMPQEGQGVQA